MPTHTCSIIRYSEKAKALVHTREKSEAKYVLCACVCDAHDRILSSGRHGIEREDASFYRLLTASVGRRGEKTRALSKFRFDRR